MISVCTSGIIVRLSDRLTDNSMIIVKIKFSHTRYRSLGPELILVYRQSAHR